MKPPAYVASLEDLPEGCPSEMYAKTEDGEGYILQVAEAEGYGLAHVGRLQSSNKAERGLRQKAEKALGLFGWKWDDDSKEYTGELDPSEARKATDDLATLRARAGDTDEEVKRRVEEHLDKIKRSHDAALGERDGTISTLTQHLETRVRDQDIRTALAAAGAIEQKRDPVEAWIQRFYRMVPKEGGKPGELVGRVLDEKGEVRIISSGEHAGQEMTLSQLVAEISDHPAFEDHFESGQKAGSGDKDDASSNGLPVGRRPKVIAKTDQAALNASIEDLAANKAVVRSS